MAFNIGAVVAELKGDISHFKESFGQAKQETANLRKSLSKVGDEIAGFGKKAAVMGAGIATAIGAVAVKAISTAGQLEQTQIAFNTLLKDEQKTSAAIAAIREDAIKSTLFGFNELAKGSQLLIGAGESAEAARTDINALADAVSATGGGVAELNRLAINLQQIRALGKAASIDIKQFAYAGINIYKLLSDTTGKTVEEVREMDITYELLTESLRKASKEGGMFAGATEAQSQSLVGLWEGLKDNIGLALAQISEDSGLQDAVKSAIQSITTLFEDAIPKVIRFFTVVGNIITYIGEIFKGNDLKAELEEALSFFFGENAAKVTEWIMGFIDAIKRVGDWIAEHQELVMTFLEGLAIALGSLLIISTIMGLLNALFNPLTLIILTVTALYMAWKNNFLGIRDITNEIWAFLKMVFEEFIAPLIEWLTAWVKDHWDEIRATTKFIFDLIITIIKTALGIIKGVFQFFIGVLTGDWKLAWEGIKGIVTSAWEGIKGIFNAAVDFIKGWGGALYDRLTEPFRKAWEKIRELVQKIKDNLDFTKRHSPSIIDILNNGVRLANKAFEGLDFNMNLSPQLAAATISNGGPVTNIHQVSVSLDGAIIGSESDAEELGEAIGDSIIRKLEKNIRI